MKTATALLGATLAALVGADLWLEGRDQERRDSLDGIRTLLDPDEAESLPRTSWLELRGPGQAVYLYERGPTGWSCRDFSDALVDGRALGELLQALQGAHGVVCGEADELTAFGLDDSTAWRLAIRTPAGTPRIRLGNAQPVADRCFAQRDGEDEVLSLETNLWRFLAGGDRSTPPLLDRTVKTASWPPSGRIRRIEVEREDERFALVERVVRRSQDELRLGLSPFEWVVEGEDPSTASPVLRAGAFVDHLHELQWKTVRPPGSTLPTQALARLRLHTGEASECVLEIARDGDVLLIENGFTGHLFEVDPIAFDRLVPRRVWLEIEEGHDPWSDAPGDDEDVRP